MLTRIVIAALASAPLVAHAGTFTTLYSFTGGKDAGFPYGPLLYQKGELYGTAYGNGEGRNGNVFKVNTASGRFKVVYSFKNGRDGAYPIGGVIEVNGLLYGTTLGGGAIGCSHQNCGTIFELDPKTGDETILYTAPSNTSWALNQLYYQNGALYGTTPYGGSGGKGSAFAFDLGSNSFTTLYNFGGAGGVYPNPSMLYENGLFYGTAIYGGEGICFLGGCGVLFAIDPVTGDETVVRSFGKKDGKYPTGALAYHRGAFFGDTEVGGNQACKHGCGVSFRIKASTGSETVLEDFENRGQDYSGITIVGENAYETLPTGGNGLGELLEVDLKSGQQTVLYTFTGGADGGDPVAALTYHGGAFYGSTDQRNGTIFKFVP